ncbi:MAG: hypothetical protein Q9179_000813 [Wetmoreana sp. 5 TL-2023]
MQPFTRLARQPLIGNRRLVFPRSLRSTKTVMSTGAAETDTQAANVANSSGITASSLQDTLKEKLVAEHVDIEDMSGKPMARPLSNTKLTGSLRWLWPSLQRHDRLIAVREEDYTGATPTCKFSFERGDCCNTRLDTEMLYAGRVAEKAKRGWNMSEKPRIEGNISMPGVYGGGGYESSPNSRH